MKDWRTATAVGTCSYDGTHKWAEGDRVYALTLGGCQRVKLYCPACALARHGAPPDPGEQPVALSTPVVRDPWTPVGSLAEGFDVKKGACWERQAMTTLQLARRIADAVLESCWLNTRYEVIRSWPDTEDVPTQAVLRAMHDTDSWFCRLDDTPQGTVQTPYEQLNLLP